MHVEAPPREFAKAIRKKDISTMRLEEKTMAQWRDNAFRSGDGARDLADG